MFGGGITDVLRDESRKKYGEKCCSCNRVGARFVDKYGNGWFCDEHCSEDFYPCGDRRDDEDLGKPESEGGGF